MIFFRLFSKFHGISVLCAHENREREKEYGKKERGLGPVYRPHMFPVLAAKRTEPNRRTQAFAYSFVVESFVGSLARSFAHSIINGFGIESCFRYFALTLHHCRVFNFICATAKFILMYFHIYLYTLVSIIAYMAHTKQNNTHMHVYMQCTHI